MIVFAARVKANGEVYDVGARAVDRGEVAVCRQLALGEIATICGADCTVAHPDGARCIIPHAALIAVREQERAREADIQAELRAMAEERIKARAATTGTSPARG